MRLVTAGVRPPQLDRPRMEDATWDLILHCWQAKPFERPAMEQIKKRIPDGTWDQIVQCRKAKHIEHPLMEQIAMSPRAIFRYLITHLNELYCISLSRLCTMTDNS